MPRTGPAVLPAGTRVHHRGCLWNRWFDEAERQERPSWGWGTVIDVERRDDGTPKLYPDNSYEYEVRYDAPHTEGGPETSWWASYHIDAAVAPPFVDSLPSRETDLTKGTE